MRQCRMHVAAAVRCRGRGARWHTAEAEFRPTRVLPGNVVLCHTLRPGCPPRLSDDGERGAVSRVVAWVPPKRLDALAVGARAR